MDSLGCKITVALLVGVLSLATRAAGAQTARSGGAGGASAQLLQQLQQLASERTSLTAENAKLKKDLEDLRKDRDALKNAQQAQAQHVKSSDIALKQNVAQRESTDRELTQTKDKLQQLIAKFRETLQTLRDIETEQTSTKQTLVTREQALKVCVDRNLALYQLNQEVLTTLEHQTVWTHVAQAEPFTRIKRFQLENLVDDYKDRATGQRVPASSEAKSRESAVTPPPASPQAVPMPAASTPPASPQAVPMPAASTPPASPQAAPMPAASTPPVSPQVAPSPPAATGSSSAPAAAAH